MQKKDPPILVTRPSLPPLAEYQAYVARIFESGFLTNGGALHRELEEKLAQRLDAPYFTLYTNGHLALESCIQAFDFAPGEIITTPFTFISTTNAIVRSGFTPVFCDVEPVYFTLDPEKLEALITPNTRAILPVHVYGNPCRVEEIEEIAARRRLPVIYDAAHVFGVTKDDRSMASYGDANMFSFHATKSFNTIEGGGVACRSAALAERLRALKNFGYRPDEQISYVGGNAKMSEFQAAMGLCNLAHFEDEMQKRALLDARYRENLASVAGVYLPPVPQGVKRNYAYFPALFDPAAFGHTRDEVAERLRRYNIYPRVYFYPLTSEAAYFKGRFFAEDTPVALRASRQALTLPMYAELAPSDVDDICQIIASPW